VIGMRNLRPGTLPGVSRSRKLVALFVAGVADLVEMALFPLFFEGAASPFDLVLDLGTAAILVGILGFRWRFVLALGAEVVPVLSLFPTWTALVLSVPSEGSSAPPQGPPRRVGPDPSLPAPEAPPEGRV